MDPKVKKTLEQVSFLLDKAKKEENINYMILKPGLNRLPKSFFDPSFSDDEGFSGLLIQKGTRNYIIRNSFKKMPSLAPIAWLGFLFGKYCFQISPVL